MDLATLARSRIVLGALHPTTLACELNLSLDLAGLGRREEALARHTDVFARFVKVLGAAHPATAAAALHPRASCDADPMPL